MPSFAEARLLPDREMKIKLSDLGNDTYRVQSNLRRNELAKPKGWDLQFWVDAEGTILYILSEFRKSEPLYFSEAENVIQRLRVSIRQKLKSQPEFNRGFSPPFLVIGRSLPDNFQSAMLNVGAGIFDLDLPSNSRFHDGEEVIAHLNRIARQTVAVPTVHNEDDDEDEPVAGDIEDYYKPITDSAALPQFLDSINKLNS